MIEPKQDKPMVTAVGKDDERNLFRSSYPDGPLFSGPLLLLTDGLSASASEVCFVAILGNLLMSACPGAGSGSP